MICSVGTPTGSTAALKRKYATRVWTLRFIHQLRAPRSLIWATLIVTCPSPSMLTSLPKTRVLGLLKRGHRAFATQATETLSAILRKEIQDVRNAGTFKTERVIASPQSSQIKVLNSASVDDELCLCANNYLGLSNHPQVVEKAKEYLDSHGAGLSSVRFICGTQVLFPDPIF